MEKDKATNAVKVFNLNYLLDDVSHTETSGKVSAIAIRGCDGPIILLADKIATTDDVPEWYETPIVPLILSQLACAVRIHDRKSEFLFDDKFFKTMASDTLQHIMKKSFCGWIKKTL